jgi:hypothetical protein
MLNFCCLMKLFWTLWITTERGHTKLKRNQKWVGLCTTLRKTLLFIKIEIPLLGFINSTTNP